MKIAVIMAVNLGDYPGAATYREYKFERSISSFVYNTYKDKHLIIVSDGCDLAKNISKKYSLKYNNIHTLQIDKQPLFSGYVRQFGIDYATNEIKADVICCLDSDDYFLENHLKLIALQIEDNDFIYSDEYYLLKSGECGYNGLVSPILAKHQVELTKNVAGTSSIAWKNKKEFNWNGLDGWGHDWRFISERLIPNSIKYEKVKHWGYVICHVKGLFDN